MANANEQLVTLLSDLRLSFCTLTIDFVSDKDPEKHKEGSYARGRSETRAEAYALAHEGLALVERLEEVNDRMVVARRRLR